MIQTPDGKTLHEVDGGVWANNPEFTAVEELKAMAVQVDKDILMVALGTGQVKLSKPAKELKHSGIIGWLVKANLIDIMMSAESEWSQEAATAIFPHNYRLQVPITPALSHMDNASEKNLAGLVQAAEAYLKEQETVVEELCDVLLKRDE
ncbi:MAG: hypothetical protein AAFQ78_02125 [Bacteroidota bacterium]